MKCCPKLCRHLSFVFLLLSFLGCRTEPKKEILFTTLDHSKTGLDFVNKLTPTAEFNMFKYMYFYNGAGVGAGDFNKDGKIDLFFSSNQGDNKLYLNEGNLHFKDVTKQTAIPQDRGWSTGVSVVDINNDGLLDIYVCRVGNFEVLKSKNQFLICTGITKNGIPTYADKAPDLGLDFSGFSTQAAFFDYDVDGDLDMFLLNHSVHQNGTFAERKVFLGTYHPLTGHRMFRNDGGKFNDVTKESKINSSAIGYGLGICVADINVDGYPDLYIGNDFHENDYLYINKKDGTFSEELTNCTMHTSQFSMGVDVADINNDAAPEIITMDMLPSDPYVLKRSLGEDEYNIFNMKVSYGYNHQYAKNALQLNRGNGVFSEVAMYSGVFATDWSWAPLWVDFNNDGLKDLFVSNGIPKRLNDIDYVNYVSNDELQSKIKTNSVSEQEMKVIDNFPEIKLPNKFFINRGDAAFEDAEGRIDNNIPTFSNGSVYADFDDDGDLDIVVNNIKDEVLLYQNKTNDDTARTFSSLTLKGPSANINAIGAKVVVYTKTGIRTYEKYPVRGFQSSMETPLLIGLYNTVIDSAFLIWPDNTYRAITLHEKLTVSYTGGLPKFDFKKLTVSKPPGFLLNDITKEIQLLHKHIENSFNEFDREPLIPHMVSREGPALAVADINKDSLDDVFIGSSKGSKSSIHLQQPNGLFKPCIQPALNLDSTYEDVDACWVDVNNDSFLDLIVASGGNEYYGGDEHQAPRIYLNDGNASFKKLDHAFQNLYLTASCIAPTDINGDGFIDLFIGARAEPWEYGQIPKSYLLINDKRGHFVDHTKQYSSGLADIGFVKSAQWVDLDKDGDKDLLIALEWDGIYAMINEKGKLEKKELTSKKGWWNCLLPIDIDKDGDIDLITGNNGLNNRLKPTAEQPVRLYYNDFDGNGKKEQVLTYYLAGKEIPFANKAELEKQMPLLKKKFLYAEDFAKASLTDLFSDEKLKSSKLLTVNYFANAVFINNGKMNFTAKKLPWQAQLTSYKDALEIDANGDNLPDIFMAGNFYDNNIQMSRYDADYGTILINKGKGDFEVAPLTNTVIRGQVRKIKYLNTKRGRSIVLVRNNDSTMVVQIRRNN